MSEELKFRYGVVFGHFDSRGGTVFVSIKEPTAQEMKGAMDFYNKDFFGYDEAEDVAYNAGVGREVDRIVDKMVRGGESPADVDYLYVARVYYREGTWPTESADLEADGFVLEEFTRGEDHPAWMHGPQPPFIYGMSNPDEPRQGTPEWEEANRPNREWAERYNRWIKTPPFPVFNLEYVQVGELRWPGMPEDAKVSSMTDEEFAARNRRVEVALAEWEEKKLKLARAAALTDFGKSAVEIPRWDDDAFGFLVIR